MNQLNFSQQNNRIIWINLWQEILENWNSSFFEISEIKKWVSDTEYLDKIGVNFTGDFFDTGRYMWPSSLDNAKLVVKEAKNYSNLYNLLINEPFDSNLNLHRSLSSLCQQNPFLIQENIGADIIFNSNFYSSNKTRREYFNSLNISTWPYEIVVISAICYLFKNVYIEYNKKVNDFNNSNKISVAYNNREQLSLLEQGISFNIDFLIREIAVYLLDDRYSKKLFSVLSKTNIFRVKISATISAFTDIFNKFPKRYYSRYLKKNRSIVKTLFRFFQVFQLNFIFCDSFIANEIQHSIKNETNSRYPSENLVKIFNIYQFFLRSYYRFINSAEKIPYSNNHQFKIFNQKLFVNTFFYSYVNDSSYQELFLEINGAVEVFKKLFPSIQFDIVKYLKGKKENRKFTDQVKKVGLIGLIGSLPLGGDFVKTYFTPMSSGTSLQVTQPQKGQKGVFRRSPIDIPRSLQRRNSRSEKQEFERYQQNRRKEYELAFNQSTLANSHTIVPENAKIFQGKDTNGLVWIQNPANNLIIPIGNDGPYASLGIALKKARDLGIPIDPNLRKAHFFYDKLRNACGVERDDGLTWLVPSCINEYEEYNENKKNRDYTYDPSFKNIPLAELVFQKTVQSWKYIVATTESNNALEPAVLDFLDKRFKNRIGDAITQLDQPRLLLGIPEDKGLYYLYTKNALNKIDEFTNILKPYALHTEGQARTTRIPGQLVSEAGDSAYSLTRLAKTYIEELDSPIAKLALSKQLETKLHGFCDQVLDVAIANVQYRGAGRENIPTFLVSFNEIPVNDIYNPNMDEIFETVEKVRDKMIKQLCGDLEEALKTGKILGIGDLAKSPKAPITQTTQKKSGKKTTKRKSSENFCYFSPPLKGKDYSDPSLWVD